MTTYAIRPVRRNFSETIAAGEEKKYTLFTQIRTLVRDPREPLSLRTYVTFESHGDRWREMITN
jgi:hypothetical protein